MRKIKSAADLQRARRRNNIIMGVVMVFLLLASTAGFAIMSADSEDDDNVNERGFDFVRTNGLWKLTVGEDVFGFSYLPSEVVNVSVNVSSEFVDYYGQPLYFVNPKEGIGEILNNLGDYVLRYQEACLDSGVGGRESVVADCDENLPAKDCSSNLIIFTEDNSTEVYSEENCVYISGDSVKGSDAFLYEILEVQ